MQDSITFTIPKDPAVMRAVADYLERIAASTVMGAPLLKDKLGAAIENLSQTSEGGTGTDYEQFETRMLTRFAAKFDLPVESLLSAMPADSGATAMPAEDPEERLEWSDTGAPGTVPGDTVDAIVPPPPADAIKTHPDCGTGVELAPDSTGAPIPWDARIHSGGKDRRLAKVPHGWKLKRGVAGAVVERVEAELRAAMAASPDRPVVTEPAPTPEDTTPDAASAFTEPVTVAPPPPPAAETTTPPPPAATPAITNFPELNAAITSAGILPAKVMEAVNTVGLAAYPLLGARPDLIPQVVEILFPAAGA